MPVIMVKQYDRSAYICLSQGVAFTSMGVLHKPRVTLPNCGDVYDPSLLLDVPWKTCTRFAATPHLFIHLVFKDDKDETTKVMFTKAGVWDVKPMYDAVRTLTAAMRRCVCQDQPRKIRDQRISLGMALHPRLGAGSPLAELGEDLLCEVVSLLV